MKKPDAALFCFQRQFYLIFEVFKMPWTIKLLVLKNSTRKGKISQNTLNLAKDTELCIHVTQKCTINVEGLFSCLNFMFDLDTTLAQWDYWEKNPDWLYRKDLHDFEKHVWADNLDNKIAFLHCLFTVFTIAMPKKTTYQVRIFLLSYQVW